MAGVLKKATPIKNLSCEKNMVWWKREDTLPERIESLERALTYIEATLNRPFDLSKVAREAGLSPFHFSRVFHSIVGEPVSEYARKRRLTAAADRLISSDQAIVDVAASAGFETQEAFTRAFKRWYGVPPARFRKRALPFMLKDTPALTLADLRALASGEISAYPIFKDLPAATYLGLACGNTMKKIAIPRLWNSFLARMGEIPMAKDRSTFGIYDYDATGGQVSVGENFPFRYLAGVEIPAAELTAMPEGMEVWSLKRARYAVFTHRGLLRNLGNTYRYIYKTWFPRQDINFAAGPFMERRAPDYPGDQIGAETQILIPIET
jgi:AraC family transcriptional regulator